MIANLQFFSKSASATTRYLAALELDRLERRVSYETQWGAHVFGAIRGIF